MGFGTDCVGIKNLNYLRSTGKKYLYYQFEKENPKLIFLPGGNAGLEIMEKTSYQCALDPTYKEPSIMYDVSRVNVTPLEKRPEFCTFSCNFDKVLPSLVDIYTPAPTQSRTNQIICVNWNSKLTENAGSRELYENGRSYMTFAQNLGYLNGKEVLIGGDFGLQRSVVKEMIKENNLLMQDSIDNLKSELQKSGNEDCVAGNVNLPQLKLYKSNNANSTDANVFVASKEMQLFNTGNATTQMYIPTRPTTFYGG